MNLNAERCRIQPTQELIDDIYLDKVRAARAASVDEKLWSGEKLFHYAARITVAGFRHENPEADGTRTVCIEEMTGLQALKRAAHGRPIRGTVRLTVRSAIPPHRPLAAPAESTIASIARLNTDGGSDHAATIRMCQLGSCH